MKVLFVDDDHLFSEKCIALLVREGQTVVYCENAEDAKFRFLESKYDIAVIDLMLPPSCSVEGLSLLQEIKRHSPTTACLMITAKQTKTTEAVAEAMKAGAKYFLDKESEVFFPKLRTYLKEIIMESKNKIFLSHGHNELIKFKIKDFIRERLKREVIVLADEPSRGLTTVVEKLEQLSETCNFAVILMTKDDEQRDGGLRARQNVVHELGFFQGKYGRKNVVLIAEKGVELPSNISGILRLDFETDHFEEVLDSLRMEIEASST